MDHKIKHGWFVIFLKTGLTMRGHITFESVLSLHLVQPLLPTSVEGLQSAFQLSWCHAIALTLASNVSGFLH
jgi:hypothetical protein